MDWYLLKKSVLRETSPDEEEQIDRWKNESEENRKYYEKLCSFLARTEQRYIDMEWYYRDFVRRRKKSLPGRILRVAGYAAAVACVVGIAMILLMISRPVLPVLEEPCAIIAGTYKAILYPGNENPVVLEKNACGKILNTGNFSLNQENNQINYTAADSVYPQSEIHTLQVPHGGEFLLCLSDGTQVYVNSESELKYPAVFVGDERRISLSGEAYFRVMKSVKPFIIEVNGMEVQVLGTEFNIRAYPDEPNCQTTLADGKVEVRKENQKVLLQPGEQAVLIGGENLSKHKVDVSKYTAWIYGNVAFEDERLEDIMAKLAKWYNIEVFYSQAELKDIRFTGNIDRYGDIGILLEKIEHLDVVYFEIKGNCITIKSK